MSSDVQETLREVTSEVKVLEAVCAIHGGSIGAADPKIQGESCLFLVERDCTMTQKLARQGEMKSSSPVGKRQNVYLALRIVIAIVVVGNVLITTYEAMKGSRERLDTSSILCKNVIGAQKGVGQPGWLARIHEGVTTLWPGHVDPSVVTLVIADMYHVQQLSNRPL